MITSSRWLWWVFGPPLILLLGLQLICIASYVSDSRYLVGVGGPERAAHVRHVRDHPGEGRQAPPVKDRREHRHVRQVPGLGSIPIIGTLFKNTQSIKSQAELLFFITPRIMNERLTGR